MTAHDPLGCALSWAIGFAHVEHRFSVLPHGWLAGAWWEGDEPFCKWEYDTANRLLFVDWAEEFCIETLDEKDCSTEQLREQLPKAALEYATQLSRNGAEGGGKQVRVAARIRYDSGVMTTLRGRLGQ
jgi:hypothetical protein